MPARLEPGMTMTWGRDGTGDWRGWEARDRSCRVLQVPRILGFLYGQVIDLTGVEEQHQPDSAHFQRISLVKLVENKL